MLFKAMMMDYESPIRMMVFDFMELAGDRGATEELRISKIGRQLKAIAKRMNIPVIALSQLNRACESRPNKLPMLSDLRASGMLEQIADNVIAIVRPEYYVKQGMPIVVDSEGDLEGVAYIIGLKRRNGPTQKVKLAFVQHLSKFAELEVTRTELNDY